MRSVKNILLLFTILASVSCQSKVKKNDTAELPKETVAIATQDLSQYETAYFASGCFWCVEAIFESVKGVKEVVSGYSGGKEKNPTYEQVGMGQTSHAESVEIYYNPKEVSFTQLVQVFFGSHDPTTLNRQGPDRGAQYRSIAFYKNDEEKKIIESYKKALEDKHTFDSPIVTEVTKFSKFYKAEDYHQDYEKNHPHNSYIQNVSIPRLNRFKKNFPDYLKMGSH